MLIELGVVEQRHKAVLELLEGLAVTEVSLRCGVTHHSTARVALGRSRRGLEALQRLLSLTM